LSEASTRGSPGAFRVTIFGAAHIDRLVRTDAEAVLGASNPGHTRDTVGGVAFNIAASLARLGVQVSLVTRIGRDAAGNRVAAAVEDAGINPHWMSRSPAAPTATYHAILNAAGSLVIGIADARIYDEITPGALAGPLAQPASLWLADANLPAETLAHIAEQSRAGGPPLAACAVSPSKVLRLKPLLAGIAIWFGNRAEAEALLGQAPGTAASDLATGLMAAGVGSGFVSDGAEPFPAWWSEGHMEIVPPFPAAMTRSVNGAGDAQAAGTVFGLSRGLGFPDALRYGRANAALKIEGEEPVRADLTRAMLESRARVEKPA
jgi:pseudouridine kinase